MECEFKSYPNVIFFEYTFSDKYELPRHFNIAVSAGHFLGASHKRFSEKAFWEIKKVGIHRFLGTRKLVFMDSSGFQHFIEKKSRIDQESVFKIQMQCKPDYASALDFPVDSVERTGGLVYMGKRRQLSKQEKDERIELTIINASKFLDLFLKHKPDFIPIATVQGYDETSYKYCAKQLSVMEFPYYGVGSCFRAPKLEVIRRVKWVREIIPKRPLHVFGIGSIFLIKFLQKQFNVKSVDTASHIVAAGYGNVFIDGKQRWGRNVPGIIGNWARRRGNKPKYELALYNAGQIEYYVFGKSNRFTRIVNYTK